MLFTFVFLSAIIWAQDQEVLRENHKKILMQNGQIEFLTKPHYVITNIIDQHNITKRTITSVYADNSKFSAYKEIQGVKFYTKGTAFFEMGKQGFTLVNKWTVGKETYILK